MTTNLHGVQIEVQDLATLYELSHDPRWEVLVKWLNGMRSNLASACLNSPDALRENCIRNGQSIVITTLETLPHLTKDVASDISKAKD